jgi:hypothetical protein
MINGGACKCAEHPGNKGWSSVLWILSRRWHPSTKDVKEHGINGYN